MILSDKIYTELTNLENEIHIVKQNKAVNNLQMEALFEKFRKKKVQHIK